MKQSLKAGIDYDNLATELMDKQGFVIVATWGDSPAYKLGDKTKFLWAQPSRYEWEVIGIVSKAACIAQQVLIRQLHPEWDSLSFSVGGNRTNSCYFQLATESA